MKIPFRNIYNILIKALTKWYGAAGSIILIMLWVSYSSMIVFFGAEFTRAYADFISGRVVPIEIAKSDIHFNSN